MAPLTLTGIDELRDTVVEVEGTEKPACVADSVARLLT